MQVGLIGAGNMARALARGWGEPVLCSDAGSGRARQLADELGGEAVASNLDVARRADLVILCHKPAQLEAVAAEIASHTKAVGSVLGGVRLSALAESYPGVPAIRLMPNTPVEVRRGVTCYCAGSEVEPALEEQVVERFDRLGTTMAVREDLLDAITALTGVGPAYWALLVEAQVDAAVRYGVTPALGLRLATETMAGTAALLAQREHDPLAVRREVTSPGGVTARGLAALERAGIRGAFQDAFDAVVGRSRA
jgi:pyrroline-5-carboxylate reductase